MGKTKLNSLFKIGDEAYALKNLSLLLGYVTEINEVDDGSYNYTVEGMCYPDTTENKMIYVPVINSKDFYTEETAIAKLIEQFDAAINSAVEHLVKLSNKRIYHQTQLRILREPKDKETKCAVRLDEP